MAQVAVENLVKHFGGVRAVDGVSFTAREGQILTLLGPSGCGKTTILRCIAGLEHPDGGVIRIGDEAVFDGARRHATPPEKRNIGMMFQAFAIWPHLRVFDNIAFPLRLRKVPDAQIRERVAEVLRSVRMEGLAERYPSQLSGGQQQRVVLARSLVYRPRVLLLDEPLANLDAKLREEMRVELRAVQREFKTTAIFVTHDQIEAMALSDHILVLREGRIVRQGAPRDIFADPRHPFVADFLGGANLLAGRVAAAGGGTVRVAIDGLGELAAAGEGEPGEAVTVGVRLGDVELGPAGGGGANTWRGRVEQVVYLGESMEWRVRVGDRLLAARGTVADWREGQDVSVTVSPARARVLHDAAATE